ncbi:MAG: prephenate dehydratase domain-containing protein [Candidatus Gracilibacteria bacterium]|nr:prephenate dehydratase domain-containing protein [Candidatus Gracilibacteria bacterium]
MKTKDKLIALGPNGSYSSLVANDIIKPESDIKTSLITIDPEITEAIRQISGNAFAASLGNLKVINEIPNNLAGIVPIHNTYGKTVNITPEAIYQLQKNHILHSIGWYSLKIEHILAGLQSTNIENITSIHSHPQAISQCINEGIARLGDDIKLVNEQSTTTHIPDLKIGEAVICNKNAAQNANLKILDEHFGPKENTTDFIVLSVNENIEGLQNLTNNKAMIILSLENRAGTLVKGLNLLSEAGVDMNSIHSQTESPGNTDFIIVSNNYIDWKSISNDLKKQGGKIKIL